MLVTAPLQVSALYAEEASETEQVAATVASDVLAVTLALPVEQALLDATNKDRAANGLPPVVMDPELLNVARQRASAQIGQPSLNRYDANGKLAFTGLLAVSG